MRFKVPPVNSNIGWRVEFRPCEVQITDFENAAFGVFIVLLTRAILTFKLNMLIPISKVIFLAFLSFLLGMEFYNLVLNINYHFVIWYFFI